MPEIYVPACHHGMPRTHPTLNSEKFRFPQQTSSAQRPMADTEFDEWKEIALRVRDRALAGEAPLLGLDDEGLTVWSDPDDDVTKEKDPSIWERLSPGRWRALCVGAAVLAIETALQGSQCGACFAILMHTFCDFEWRTCLLGWPIILAHAFVPSLLPPLDVFMCGAAAFDIFLDLGRGAYVHTLRAREKNVFSVPVYLAWVWLVRFQLGLTFRPLIPLLEALLGPSASWTPIIIPILPTLLLREERGSINGFVPEEIEGFFAALLCWLCVLWFPVWLQWPLYAGLSFPNWDDRAMFGEWLVLSATWAGCKVKPPVAYGALLFVNQFVHAEARLRQTGGGVSSILRRERCGAMWYGCTLLVLQILRAVSLEQFAFCVGSLMVPIYFQDLKEFFARHPYFRHLVILTAGIRWARKFSDKMEYDKIQYKDGIRLLRLLPQPTRRDSPIQCDLIHARLECPPQYTTISYYWGSPSEDDKKEIIINGRLFKISPSIHTLLLAKRSAWRTVVVWIDAICINQCDDFEKSTQVGLLMRRIYEEASCTIGWLGDDQGDAKGLFRKIKAISDPVPPVDDDAVDDDTMENLGDRQYIFDKVFSNPWFQRVWIIQEVATSRNPILRCGNEELPWTQFVSNAWALLYAAFPFRTARDIVWDNHGLVNVLVMDSIRRHVETVDYLKLKDTLKLGLRFRATLPIDKVYGLLGIAEERRTPVLRPNMSNDKLGVTAMRGGHAIADLSENMALLSDLLGDWAGGSGRVSRRANAMARSADTGQVSREKMERNLFALFQDSSNNVENLKRLVFGTGGEEDEKAAGSVDNAGPGPLPVVYSGNSSAEQAYIYTAKNLVKEGDIRCLFRFSGQRARHAELEKLPSWVPDWSLDLKTYILPRPIPNRPPSPQCNNSNVRIDGARHLLVKGVVVGLVERLFSLGQGLDGASGVQAFESAPSEANLKLGGRIITKDDELAWIVRATRDVNSRMQRYSTAIAAVLRHQPLRERAVRSDSEVIDDFFLTTMANVGPTGRPATAADVATHRKNVERGFFFGLPLRTALEAPDEVLAFLPGYPEDKSEEARAVRRRRLRTNVAGRYLLDRRLQFSGNSLFAHLVRTDILPSFSEYRWKLDREIAGSGEEKTTVRKGWVPPADNKAKRPLLEVGPEGSVRSLPVDRERALRALDMFGNQEGGALAGFVDLVDYHIGRCFAILESGFMGLVPEEAKVGDRIVWLENENMYLVLRSSADNSPGFADGTTGLKNMQAISVVFIGDSYVHGFDPQASTGQQFARQEFRLR